MKKSLRILLIISIAGLLMETNALSQTLKDGDFKTIKSTQGFIENKGQIIDQNYEPNPGVKYLLNMSGLNIQLKANSFSYDAYIVERHEKEKKEQEGIALPVDLEPDDNTFRFHRIDIEFIGSNTSPQIVAEEPGNDYINYYTSGTTEEGATYVNHYGKITYKNLYPGIDLVFYARPGTKKPVEYNFIVHPGADLSLIQWKYEGSDNIKLHEGIIQIQTAHGLLNESIPHSFEKETGKTIKLGYRYMPGGIFALEGINDQNNTLVIDPIPDLKWATYFGGALADLGYCITTDASGNVYVTGATLSTTMIATTGAHQTTIGGGTNDGFVVKFDAVGARLWSTYYGGTLIDFGGSICVDKTGNVYVGGSTQSTTGISTTGAFQAALAALYDAFVVKFGPTGTRIWGTYYGGSGNDLSYYNTMVLDTNANVYLAGVCNSTGTQMSTPGAYKTTMLTSGDPYDAFLIKLNSSGARQWSSYFGGTLLDYGFGLGIDANSNLLMTGYTTSTTGLATTGAHQTVYGGSTYDAYLAKWTSAGACLWATYLGGTLNDVGYGTAADPSGNIFLTGYSVSTNAIASTGAYQTTYGGGTMDAFLAKFSPTGTRLWSTYYGGLLADMAQCVATDLKGNAFISGRSLSTAGIATTGTYQTSFGGGTTNGDAMLVKFSSTGALLWGTYYGGTGEEHAGSIALDPLGFIYVTGSSGSATGISTSGAYQVTNAGGTTDAFVSIFQEQVFRNDAGIISINKPVSPMAPGMDTLKAVLKNYGTDTLKSVGLRWSVNGSNQSSPADWTGALLQNTNTGVLNFGTYNFTSGIYNIKAWTNSPNGVLDSLTSNDTARLTIYSCNPLNGTYVIDPSGAGNFKTFNLAIDWMKNCGISGPVTFRVKPGTYNEQISIPAISGSSATNNIIFETYNLDSSSVNLTYAASSASNNWVLRFNGCSYVTFRKMTVTATGASFGRVVEFINQANYISLLNNRLIGVNTISSTTDFCVVFSDGTSATIMCQYNTIKNNVIQYGSYGIYYNGYNSTPFPNFATIIENNYITSYYYAGIYAQYQTGLNIMNNSIQTTSSVSPYGIFINGVNTSKVNNNTITLPNAIVASYGIKATSANNSSQFINNSININYSNTTLYGMHFTSCLYNSQINNNTINLTGLSTIYGLYATSCSSGFIANANNISVNSSAGSQYGMYISSCYGDSSLYMKSQLVKNKIQVNGANASINYGIALISFFGSVNTFRALVANNFISMNNGTAALYGIWMSTGSYWIDFLYNNINITSGSATSAGFYLNKNSTNPITILNNISCMNHPTAANSGYAIYVSNATTYSTMDTINNNNWFTTGTNIGYYNSLACTTMPLWISATSKDLNSQNVNPNYVSNTDLHASHLTLFGTGAIYGGSPATIGGTPLIITDDIDGQTRSAGAPCIGADEFTVVSGLDAGIASLATPSAANPGCPGSVSNVTVRVLNYGTTTITSVDVKYKINSGGTVYTSSQSSISLSASTYLDVNLGSININRGDTLYAWTSSPNSGTDLNTSNDLFKIKVPLRLTGTLTIGGSNPNFTDVTRAVFELNSMGVCGAVTFNIRQGTYSGNYIINAFSGAGASNPVVFQPDPANTQPVILTYAPGGAGDNFVVAFNGANLYTTFLNLTLTNTNIAAAFGTVVKFCNTVATSYVKLQGCTLNSRIVPAASTNDAVIYHTSTYAATYDSIVNCNINNGQYGIYWYGSSAYEAGNGFKNNNINNFYGYGIYVYYQSAAYIYGNTINSSSLYTSVYGIYGYYNQTAYNISNNIINVKGTSSNWGINLNSFYISAISGTSPQVSNNVITVSNGTSTTYGVYMSSCYGFAGTPGTIVNNNKVTISYGTTNNLYGIYLTSCYGVASYPFSLTNNYIVITAATSGTTYGVYLSTCYGVAGAPLNVYNNYVAITAATGATDGIYYTYSTASGYTNFYFNTVNILTGSTAGYALYIYSSFASGAFFNIKNNNIVNFTTGYAIYYNDGAIATSSIDTNNYYAPNTSKFGYYNTSTYASYSAWKTAMASFSREQASINVNPGFYLSTDPKHYNSLLKVGATGTGVTTDIFGSARPNPPTIGAYELARYDIGISANLSPASLSCAGNKSVSVRLKNYGTNTLTSDTIRWTINGVPQTPYNWTGSVNMGDSTSVSLGNYNFTGGTPYNIKAYTSNINGTNADAIHFNDSSSINVTLTPNPVAAFSPSDTARCLTGNTFTFTNNTTISSGSFNNYWTFGDTTSSTSVSPTHVYIYAGTPYVKLVATSLLGCKDSITKNIYVRPHPKTAFTPSDTSLCLSTNNFTFFNNTTIGSGSFSSLWKFGDNATSTLLSPAHSYSSTGTYSVRLITTSNYSCKDSLTKNVTVKSCLGEACVNSTGNKYSVNSGNTNYIWSVLSGGTITGGGTTTDTFAIVTWNTAGINTVKVVFTKPSTLKDSTLFSVTVRPLPTSAFSIDSTLKCLRGNSFAFTNTTTGASAYLWKFGDAFTTNTLSPSHSYTTAGAYTVKLISTTTYGCKDSIAKNLNVRPHPVTNFSIDSTLKCLRGNSFAFTNSTTGATTYLWKFGDLATATTTNPSHSYTSLGSYGIRLVTTSSYGCKDSNATLKTVNVWPHPVTNFSIDSTLKCLRGNSFAFTNSTTGATTYLWKFGDLATATTTNPSHSYAAVGSYGVRLVATSSYGCKDSNATLKTVNVRPHPVTNFSIDSTLKCLRGNSFAFTNSTTGATTYLWKFGDLATATTTNSSHSYATFGSYGVRLVTTSVYGCKDSNSTLKTVNVWPHPVTNFSIDSTLKCLRGNSFAFTNSTTGATTYLWKFGDLATATTTNTSHSYATVGSYGVRLVTTSVYGCKDSNSTLKTVNVWPHPVTNFSIDSTLKCLRGNSIVFTNSTTGAATYTWKFGDLGTATTTNASHSYTTVGSYGVRLITTSAYGCTDSNATLKTVNVWPHPVTNFSIDSTLKCLRGNSIVFTNSTTGAATNLWKFGDLGTATTTNASHSYATVGSYGVRLVTTSAYGCKDSNTTLKNVNIRPHPVTSFTINNNSQCLRGNSFIFTNTTTGASAYNWNFGDAATSTTTSPTHGYTTAGAFTVKLVSTTTFGCKDSTTNSTQVNPSPTASYNQNADKQCFSGNLFAYANTSTISGGSINSLWNFGDADTSTVFSPSHTYLTADTFQVRLKITSDKACSDSVIGTVVVFPQPNTGIILSDTGLCLSGNNFTFTDTTVSKDTIAAYYWDFGDGNSDTIQNTIHSYATDGDFNIKHFVSTSNGCIDSITKMLTVYPQPQASFTVNDTNQCLKGNEFEYTNTSTISSGKVNYFWDLGDGTTNTDTNNTHSYALVNTYQVMLKVMSLKDCSDSTIKTIYLKSNPVVNLGKDTTIKGNQSLLLKAGSGFDAYLWTGGATTDQITVDSATYGLGIDTFWVKVTQNGCSGSDTIRVEIISSVSIDDPESNFKLKVYPNPVNSLLNIELSSIRKEMVITLTDMNGKQMKSVRIQPDKLPSMHQIDVSELARGVYYLNISNSETRKVTKIVKY